MQRSPLRFMYVASCSLFWLIACQPTRAIAPSPLASLRTDSTSSGVRRESGYWYRATIPFTYTNESGKPVSKAGCGGPVLPNLEKKVGDTWVVACYPVYLLCLTVPDFVVENGATYRGVLGVAVSQPGHNSEPSLLVDSIDGVFRLRWDLTAGREAGAKGAKIVAGTSSECSLRSRII